jgi:hypothetical protein
MINIEEIKQQLDPKEILEKMKSIAGGDLLEIEKLIENKKVFIPISVSEHSSLTEQDAPKVESFNLVDQGLTGNNQVFVVDKILDRTKKIVEYIRFPEYPKEMQQVLGEINRVVRFTRHYSILSPDIAFCQKHSIFVVKSNTSMSSEFSFVLPLMYQPITVNGMNILSPSIPSKKIFLVIPFFSNLKKDETGDTGDSNRRYLSYSINKDNVRVVTSGGRSFRTYHSFYYRGAMRIHIGDTREELNSPYEIINIRDQIQNYLNDIKTELVGGIPKGYPAISDIVLEGGTAINEGTSEESENAYVAMGIDDNDLENDLIGVSDLVSETEHRILSGWNVDDLSDIDIIN